jgi:hypothetical protein
MMSRIAGALFGFAVLLAAVPTQAAAITFTGSDSGGRAAKVTFENIGSTLVMRLKNTTMADVGVPNQVLTGVFFNVAGNPLLTATSAVLGATSSVLFDSAPAGGDVGGEWAYRNGLTQYGANTGISSTGLSLFGAGNRFPGANLDGPDAPDGLQYGITSAGDNPTVGNTKVTGASPLIKNEVVFTLGNWTLGDPTDYLSNVTFQYGTDLSEPSIPGRRITITQVPEPAALLLFGVAGVALRFRSKRKRE